MNTLIFLAAKYGRFIRIGVVCSALVLLFAGSAYGQGDGLDIKPPGGNEDLVQLVNRIADYILTIALPIAFGMIIYAGVLFTIARGDQTKVTKAKEILKYAVIGLAIILINKGFVTLIADVLGTETPK